jgi:predicted PurR-regulated permease PerM
MTASGPPSHADDGSILTPDLDPTAQPTAAGAATRTPDIGKLGRVLRDDVRVRSFATTGLFVLALLYTLYFARAFFLPIVFAVLLDFLLSPVIRALERIRIPAPLGAALVLLLVLGAASVAVYELSGPAQNWIAKAPASLASAGTKLRELQQPVEKVAETAERVERAADVDGESETPEVVVRGPSFAERVFGTTQTLVIGLIEVIVLLYFLLAAGDLFLQKLIKVLPQLQDKRKAVQIARETEASVSTYLLTVALVNVGEGIAVAAAMFLLGMPSPMLWGALAVLAELVPYLGAVTMTGILTLVAFTTFDSVGYALLVPATFMAINFVQAYFVSPMVLGHRLTLNPVAILVSVVFFFWIWGVPGAFIAVPLIATFKIVCDHIETLAPVGEFLGR